MTKSAFSTLTDLHEAGFEDMDASDLQDVSRTYAIRVTSAVLGTIKNKNLLDPVALQYVPQPLEMRQLPEENPDPIGDRAHSPVKGIVHRYPDRVLYKIAHVCAVYCRYCFRREMVGPAADGLSAEEHEAALSYIARTPEIREVLLTGGDPLVLSPRRLSDVLTQIAAVPHVEIIRIHTRIPVADPGRITPDLCAVFENLEKPVYVAIHANHAQEFSAEAMVAVKNLRRAGCILLSQSVLLKGVNDSAPALEDLLRMFVKLGVKPYYLHHPDMAQGTSHFRVSIAEGQKILRELQGRVSGLCMPHYMLDIPGGHGKSPVGPSYISEGANGTYTVEDYQGRLHAYPPSKAGDA